MGITRPRPDGGVTRKAPLAIDPAVVVHPPGVTQDTSPDLCSERRDEYLFGLAKIGGLGQVTTKKKEKPSPPLAVQNTVRSLKI